MEMKLKTEEQVDTEIWLADITYNIEFWLADSYKNELWLADGYNTELWLADSYNT